MKKLTQKADDRVAVLVNWGGIASLLGKPSKTERQIKSMRLAPPGTRARRKRKRIAIAT